MRMLRPWHSLAAPWHWPSSSRLQRTQRLRRHQSSAERLNIPIRICGSTITQDKKFGTWGQNWDLFRTISKLWSQSRSNLIFGTSRKHGLHNCRYTKFITSKDNGCTMSVRKHLNLLDDLLSHWGALQDNQCYFVITGLSREFVTIWSVYFIDTRPTSSSELSSISGISSTSIWRKNESRFKWYVCCWPQPVTDL